MLTKSKMMQLRAEITLALQAVGKKHGVSLNLGNGTFTPATGTFKLNILEHHYGSLAPRDHLVAQAEVDFRLAAASFGLKEEMLGQTFRTPHATYKVLGLMPRRHKFPVLVKDLNHDKNVCMTVDSVLAYSGRIV